MVGAAAMKDRSEIVGEAYVGVLHPDGSFGPRKALWMFVGALRYYFH